MVSKSFFDKWTDAEIIDYIDEHDILILFEISESKNTKEAKMDVYGKLDDEQKADLYINLTEEFGKEYVTEELGEWINSFAKWWYERKMGPSRIRIINIGKKRG